jgi:hypothetical protein
MAAHVVSAQRTKKEGKRVHRAKCSCGWVGRWQLLGSEAYQEASNHTFDAAMAERNSRKGP